MTDPAALQHIGMPIGGLFSGNLYLGGDGKLWLWDIFNHIVEGILPRRVEYKGQVLPTRNGANYVSPPQPQSPIDQGFAVRIDEKVRRLDQTGFKNISFRGQYPIGIVNYSDEDCPVCSIAQPDSPIRVSKEPSATTLCSGTFSIAPASMTVLDIESIAAQLNGSYDVKKAARWLRIKTPAGADITIMGRGNAIFRGVNSVEDALSVYREVVGPRS